MDTFTRLLLGALLALATLAPVSSDAAPTAGDPLYDRAPALAKASRVLLDSSEPRAALRSLGDRAPGYRTVAGRPELDIRLVTLTPAIVDRARAAGLEVLDADYRHARLLGYCPSDCLAELASIPQITAIHPNYGARTRTGDVTSQADVSIRAAEARDTFGVDGTGVRIGVISDTFTQRTAGTFSGRGCARSFEPTGRGSAEIPETVNVIAEPRDFPGVSFNGVDEGRAMAELIYDLAPGADLSYHTAFTTQSIFVRAIEDLVECGADIIVDDVIYFSEPMFQDGIIAQAAIDAVEQDVAFFSAIGNLGPWGVDEHYLDANPEEDDDESTPTGNDLHRFGNGSPFATVTIPRGCGLRMILQWNEPFSGVLGDGASSDLDLYACPDDNPLTCQASSGSRDPQGCSIGNGGPNGDPIEILDVTNFRSTDRTFYIAVEHSCGDEDVRFRIVSFALGCQFPDTYVFDPAVFNTSQAYGHPAARGVIGTAAVFYPEIDSDGAHQGDPEVVEVEPFSSKGGEIPIYIDRDGERLADGPEIRINPLIAAPDGTNTSFFGLRDAEGDDLLNFFGTSAAAPHAAAVAALLLEANPTLSQSEVLDVLQRTARDIEAPGFDPLSGSGLIDAVDAVAEAIARLTATPSPTATPSFTRTATATPRPPTPTPEDACPGDCNRSGKVTVDELVRGVRINLGTGELASCTAADVDRDGDVTVDELVQAVNANLDDACPA